MHHDLVGSFCKGESASGMTLLSTGFASCGLSQRDGLLEAIAGRGLAAVVTIFVQPIPQLLDLGLEGVDLLLLGRSEGLQDAVLALLRARLEVLSEDDEVAIKALHDPPALTALIGALGQARGAEEARAALAAIRSERR